MSKKLNTQKCFIPDFKSLMDHQIKHDRLRTIASNWNNDGTKKVDPMVYMKKKFQIATSSQFDLISPRPEMGNTINSGTGEFLNDTVRFTEA